MVICPGCQNYVGLSASGGLPPWCPKCGSDLKAAPKPPPQAATQAPILPTVQPVEEYDPQLPPLEAPVEALQPMRASAPITTTRPPRRREPAYDEDDEYSPQRVAAEAAWNKACKESAMTLFVVGGLSILGGLLVFAVLGAAGGNLQIPGINRGNAAFVGAVSIVMGVLYVGLGWWAFYQPLPPILIGLGIYVIDAVLYAITLVQARQVNYSLLIKVAIAAAFLQAAVKAAKAVKPTSRRRPQW